MTVWILVSLLQRVSPKLSLPFGSAWLHWQICQYRSQFGSKIRFDLETKIKLELQRCISPLWLQTFFLSDTGPNRTLLWIHPLIRVPSWSRGIVYARHWDWFPSSLGDGRAYKNCPFRLISNLLRSIVWINSGLLISFQVVARIIATGFLVDLHWLAFLQDEVV